MSRDDLLIGEVAKRLHVKAEQLGKDYDLAKQVFDIFVPSTPAPNGKYGVMVKGRLIPEVVKHRKLEIGRFEVTRAQYFFWDNGYPIAKGTDNFPANGITPPQAMGYCDWLSSLTGESWRLPKESEAADLYKDSRGENVLGSGRARTSDSCTRLKPSMAEPSKVMPSSRAFSSSAGVMLKTLGMPRTSVNQSSMTLTRRSSTVRST